MSKDLRMSDKGLFMRIPPERTNTELNNGEFLSGVLNFEVTNIIPVEFERFSPRSTGDSGHFQINGDEIGVP